MIHKLITKNAKIDIQTNIMYNKKGEVYNMIYLALITLLIVLFVENTKYKNENDSLRKEIKELTKEKVTINKEKMLKNEPEIYGTSEQVNEKDVISSYENKEKTAFKAQKINHSNSKDENEIKNNFILITGSVLIVIAAIVFLTSTWSSLPNIIKTAVLILVAGLFLGTSHIAKKYLKLEHTANAFFYIAMVYIPIVFLSISIFKIFGEYLSIYGQGKYIYFALTSLIISAIYISIGNKQKKLPLIYATMIFQVFAVTTTILIFTENIKTITLGVIIYNVILICTNHKLKIYEKIINNFSTIYLYILTVIELIFILSPTIEMVQSIGLIILTISYYIKFKNSEESWHTYILLAGVLISIYSILNLNIFNLGESIIQLMMTISTVILYFIGMLKLKLPDARKMTMLNTAIAIGIIYIFSLSNEMLLKDYSIIYIATALLFTTYFIIHEKRYFKAALIGVFLGTYSMVVNIDLSYNYLVAVCIFMFIASIVGLMKNKEENLNYMQICNGLLIVSCLIEYIEGVDYNKIALSILCIANLTNTILEMHLFKDKKEMNNIYTIGSNVVTLIVLNIDLTMVDFIFEIITSISFILYAKNQKINQYINLIPMLAIVPSIYFSDIATIEDFNFMGIISFILCIITSLASVKDRKINVFTFVSGGYILLHIMEFSINTYLNLGIILVWAIWHMINIDEYKNVFKCIAYISTLFIYNNIIDDLDLTEITAIYLLGYITTTFVITRTILKIKYKDIYKAIEYIACAILYIWAISLYQGEFDGMIFVLLLVVLTIVSYVRKFGPIFLSSIIAILVNAFLLTREFWFSIPWWCYLLVIGLILISFALRNEMEENKSKDKLVEKANYIKEKLDI